MAGTGVAAEPGPAASGPVVGLARHTATERSRPGASPGTELLFPTLERSLRSTLGRRVPVVHLPLGEFPRGAWCHLHQYLEPGDAVWFSSTAARAVHDRLVASSPAQVRVLPFGLLTAPSDPICIGERWLPPMRTRSWEPKARPSTRRRRARRDGRARE